MTYILAQEFSRSLQARYLQVLTSFSFTVY